MREDHTTGLTDFQQRAATAATVKMLTGKHFSICDLDAIAKVIGATQRMAGPDYDALRSIHCVDWSDMGPELATMAREKCLELLGMPPQIIDVLATGPATSTPQPQASRLRLAFWRSA